MYKTVPGCDNCSNNSKYNPFTNVENHYCMYKSAMCIDNKQYLQSSNHDNIFEQFTLDPSTCDNNFNPQEIPKFFIIKSESEFVELFISFFNNEFHVTDGLSTRKEICDDACYNAFVNVYGDTEEVYINGEFNDDLAHEYILDQTSVKNMDFPLIVYVNHYSHYSNSENEIVIFDYVSLNEMI